MLTANPDFLLRDRGVSNASEVGQIPRHRWYIVKEAFSPRLVEAAIEADGVERGESLLDPFAGSGTVPVTAALAGLRADAFEVNPFLRFVASTKLRGARAEDLVQAKEIVLRATKKPQRSRLEGYSTFTCGNRWHRWLFPTAVIRGFEAGMQAIEEVDMTVRPLVKLALIGAAMDCCNASRDGKCLRFRKGWRDHEATVGSLRDQLGFRLAMMAEDIAEVPIRRSGGAKVVEGDARKLISRLPARFRICVTSPPYLNSFDYSDVYRPEMFLGGFVDSNQELMRIRLKTLRSHVQATWEPPTRDDFGTLYDACISELSERAPDLWDWRLPRMVQAYFEDMERVLSALRERAAERANIWLVVSTSAYAGVEVPVDLILAEIGQRCGWYLREVGVLRYLRSSSQHVRHVGEEGRRAVPLRESAVILDATRSRSS